MDWHSRRPEEEHAALEAVLPERSQQPIRKLFRAGLGTRVVGNHYTYVTADGRVLFSMGAQEEAVSLLQVRVEHRNRWRTAARDAARNSYYERRGLLRIERLGVRPAVGDRSPGSGSDDRGCPRRERAGGDRA
jgi:hypothetical protein